MLPSPSAAKIVFRNQHIWIETVFCFRQMGIVALRAESREVFWSPSPQIHGFTSTAFASLNNLGYVVLNVIQIVIMFILRVFFKYIEVQVHYSTLKTAVG